MAGVVYIAVTEHATNVAVVASFANLADGALDREHVINVRGLVILMSIAVLVVDRVNGTVTDAAIQGELFVIVGTGMCHVQLAIRHVLANVAVVEKIRGILSL